MRGVARGDMNDVRQHSEESLRLPTRSNDIKGWQRFHAEQQTIRVRVTSDDRHRLPPGPLARGWSEWQTVSSQHKRLVVTTQRRQMTIGTHLATPLLIRLNAFKKVPYDGVTGECR